MSVNSFNKLLSFATSEKSQRKTEIKQRKFETPHKKNIQELIEEEKERRLGIQKKIHTNIKKDTKKSKIN